MINPCANNDKFKTNEILSNRNTQNNTASTNTTSLNTAQLATHVINNSNLETYPNELDFTSLMLSGPILPTLEREFPFESEHPKFLRDQKQEDSLISLSSDLLRLTRPADLGKIIDNPEDHYNNHPQWESDIQNKVPIVTKNLINNFISNYSRQTLNQIEEYINCVASSFAKLYLLTMYCTALLKLGKNEKAQLVYQRVVNQAKVYTTRIMDIYGPTQDRRLAFIQICECLFQIHETDSKSILNLDQKSVKQTVGQIVNSFYEDTAKTYLCLLKDYGYNFNITSKNTNVEELMKPIHELRQYRHKNDLSPVDFDSVCNSYLALITQDEKKRLEALFPTNSITDLAMKVTVCIAILRYREILTTEKSEAGKWKAMQEAVKVDSHKNIAYVLSVISDAESEAIAQEMLAEGLVNVALIEEATCQLKTLSISNKNKNFNSLLLTHSYFCNLAMADSDMRKFLHYIPSKWMDHYFETVMPPRERKRLEALFPTNSVTDLYKKANFLISLLKYRKGMSLNYIAISNYDKDIILHILSVVSKDQGQLIAKEMLQEELSYASEIIQLARNQLMEIDIKPENNVDFDSLLLIHTSFLNSAINTLSRKIISTLPASWLESYLRTVFYHPKAFQPVIENLFKLTSIELKDGGNGVATWVDTVETLLTAFGRKQSSKPTPTDLTEAYKKVTEASNPPIETIGFTQLTNGWEFDRVLGRTLLYKNKNGGYRAFKFQRSTESLDTLWHEHSLVDLLNSDLAKSYGLKTVWPKPINVYNISTPPTEIEPIKLPLKVDTDGVNCYVYEYSDSSYFVYLHDPSLNVGEFEKARQVMLHDVFVLARHGIVYTALADLFHNFDQKRSDQGHYLPMVDLFARQPGRWGAGRLTDMWGAVEYPNARASGLADPTDTDLVDRISAKLSKTIFNGRTFKGLEGVHLFLLAHFMASYLLVDQLIVGRRNLHNMDWKNETVINELGQKMANGFAIALAAYTNLPRETVDNFVQNCGLNWAKLGRQMCFFMRNDEQGYVPYVSRAQIPSEIYGDAKCIIDPVSKLRGWDTKGGFMLNGTPDSGPVNGQTMVKVGEQSWYLMALFSAVMKNSETKAYKWKSRAIEAQKDNDQSREIYCLMKSKLYEPRLEIAKG